MRDDGPDRGMMVKEEKGVLGSCSLISIIMSQLQFRSVAGVYIFFFSHGIVFGDLLRPALSPPPDEGPQVLIL